MVVPFLQSWGTVYQEIENLCSNNITQVGQLICEKLDQAVIDWLDPHTCVSEEDEDNTTEAESTTFLDMPNKSSETALPSTAVTAPLAGLQSDPSLGDEALTSISYQNNSIKEGVVLTGYTSPTTTDDVIQEGTCTSQDFITDMEENEPEQQIEHFKSVDPRQETDTGVSDSFHKEDVCNNMHVLDLETEEFEDVNLHAYQEDDDEDYDLALALYYAPRKTPDKKKISTSFISKLRKLRHYMKADGKKASKKASNHDSESEWVLL